MLRVGLTGGLASGKTQVAQVFQECGAEVLHADQVGHEVLSRGGEAYAPVLAEFGEDLLDANGSIVRRRLAARVFGQPERLAVLNGIVHPAVWKREEEWMAAVAVRNPTAIAVVEAAILIETGSYQKFDRLVLAYCPEAVQVERAMQRDGVSREEALARLSHQMPLKDKLPYADFVIDTAGSKESTNMQARDVYRSLRSIA